MIRDRAPARAAALAARSPCRSARSLVAFVVMAIVLLATGHAAGAHLPAALRLGVLGEQRARRHAHLGDAAPLHRALRRGRVPDAALQHRRRGPALRRRDHRRGGAALAIGGIRRRLSIPAMIVAGAAGGAALALIPAILQAFLSTNEIITSLMLNYVVALVISYLIFDSQSYWRDTSTPDGEGLPAGQEPARRGELADVRTSGRSSLPFGFLLGVVIAVVDLAALHAHAVRLRGEGDRRLAARRALRGHAHAAEDPRGDGALGRDRRHRRREPGRRLPPHSRPARPDGCRATATRGS